MEKQISKFKDLWLFSDISFKLFKKLSEPFGGDIRPKEIEKILWKCLRDRTINIYFSQKEKDRDDPMIITTKLPPKKALFIKEIK